MKIKVMSLLFSLGWIPFSLYAGYLLLVHVAATELMWFLYVIGIPAVFISVILSKLAEWEDD